MAASIRPVRVNHINIVLEEFDRGVAHFRDLYCADFLMDMPQAEWHACLIEIGRDIGVALHTHPADCLGVAFEFYDGHVHDNAALLGRPMKDARFWREEHPLGLTGLHGYRIAVRDADAAREFLQRFLSAEPVHDIARPAMAARCIGLRIADSMVELLTPTGHGPLQDHLLRFGAGMHSTVFEVRSIARARQHFAARGTSLIAGVDPTGFAIPAQANGGVLFEFIGTAQ